MLRDATVAGAGDEGAEWAWESAPRAEAAWQEIDRTLRGIAKRRAALDAEEARWLREAERVEVWKPLGMVNMIDYLERVLGYAPRTGQQRMQVARALETLPVVTDALASGELPFSAVRELVRVATPATEAAWCAHVGGMNVRQIEEAVSGHRPGDLPSDPPDPEAREHIVTLVLDGAAYAMWREGRLRIDEAHGRRLADSELVTAVFSEPRVGGDGKSSGRAKFQIALTVCPRCERGTQLGAGVSVPVDAATVARARCDAQHIGSLDGDGPEKAHQDVPPSVVRFIHRRDEERCQTPGCRSALGVEIHHIVHREARRDPRTKEYDVEVCCLPCRSPSRRPRDHGRGSRTDRDQAGERTRTSRPRGRANRGERRAAQPVRRSGAADPGARCVGGAGMEDWNRELGRRRRARSRGRERHAGGMDLRGPTAMSSATGLTCVSVPSDPWAEFMASLDHLRASVGPEGRLALDSVLKAAATRAMNTARGVSSALIRT